MNDILSQLHLLPYFSTKTIIALGVDPSYASVWLHRGVQSGTIERICSGWYLTHEKKQELIHTKKRSHRFYHIACNVLYPGAVISHETALALYQVIPEMVTITICVTRKKTRTITTPR
jgi:predicted transcriptional regulator of viral defense system